MKVAVIGGGFTGLSAAEYLINKGVKVEVWEASDRLGGLAGGFEVEGWNWDLEKYYHHVFANDRAIIGLAEKMGWPVCFQRPKTNVWLEGEEEQLDSAMSLLRFSQMEWGGKLWMGGGLAGLKLLVCKNWGQSLERYKVSKVLPKMVGREGYEKVWEPLLKAKFGRYADVVNMAWFWARVIKRTSRLGYFEGGFGKLAEKIGGDIENKGGRVRAGSAVTEIKKRRGGWVVNGESFEKVLLTVPSRLADEMVQEKVVKGVEIDYLWGQTLILELKKSLIESYWLNILEEWPFLVAVEQTKFIDKSHYGDNHIVYLGNYLAEDDERLEKDKDELLEMFWPYLKKLNNGLRKSWIRRMWKFQSAFAQPVFPINYSSSIPSIRTGIKGLYIANMSQVYPWDRGTNYAVEIGQKAAKMVWEERDGS